MAADHDTRVEWRDIPGFPRYQVSNRGEVRSRDARGRWRPMKVRADARTRYCRLIIRSGNRPYMRSVHQLVMLAFVGPRPAGMQVRHLNDVRSDNRLENLAYGTPKQNMADCRRNRPGFKQGTNQANAKLNDDAVGQIWDLVRQGVSPRAIGLKFGVARSTITNIVYGRRWKHVT